MDAASEALCWAKYTLDNFIVKERASRISKPSGTAPPEPLKTKLQLLFDNVDTNTLKYIASQHNGECYFDTLQNILMFADGYREINASFAKELFIKYPKELLNDVDGETITKEINTKFTIGAGSYNANLNRFLANTFRRYILIKLAEKGTSINDINTAIGGQLKFNPSGVGIPLPPLHRNPSINLRAGIDIQQMGQSCVPTGRLEIFSQLMEPEIYKTKFTIIDKEYKSLKYDNKELIGVFMIISPDDTGANHAIGIIRNDNKYYIIDNNVGISIEVTNIDKFDGKNFIVKYNKNGTNEYLFGSDSIKSVKSSPTTSNVIFKQSVNRFIYCSKT